MADITKKCKECGEDFVLSDNEQNWYKEKNYTLPERCKSCRDLRRRKIIGKEDNHYGKKD